MSGVKTPTFTQIEYPDHDGEWRVGHAGINLLDPEAYVDKLAARGQSVRATAVDTGEVWERTVGKKPKKATGKGTRAHEQRKVKAKATQPAPAVDDEDDDLFADLDAMLADTEDEAEVMDPTPELKVDELVEYQEVLAEVEEAMHDADLPAWSESDLSSYEAGATDEKDELDDLLDGLYDEAGTYSEDEDVPHLVPMFMPHPDPRFKDFIFDGHAGAGPSGAERWMNCTASLEASRAFLETLSPRQQTEFAMGSEAARQGTTAHAAAEVEARVMLGEVSQEEMDHTLLELAVEPPDGEFYDDSMQEYINEYTDLVESYIRGGREVLIEERVSALVPLVGTFDGEIYEVTGSTDFAVLPSEAEPQLVVGDLKYGNGIDVDVDSNPQIRIYGLGLLTKLADPETGELPDIESITYYIVQPRLGGIKMWSETVDDLLTWRDEALAPALSAALAGTPEATFNPSEEACKFCPARGNCAALAQVRVDQAAEAFDAITEAEFENGPGTLLDSASMTDTRLGELLAQITGLISIHKDLKEEAQRRLHRGGSVPGFQLVEYTPVRKWLPEASETLEDLDEVWADRKLLTPKQAMLALKGNEAALASLEGLYETPDKRPVIAPEGDRRKTWQGKAPEAMFQDESGE